VSTSRSVARCAAIVIIVTLSCVAGASSSARATSPPVRGFDGSTLKVAGFGIKSQLPGAETGARARIQRFNNAHEIKGVQIEYTEFADDKQDPATALSEARRLVSEDDVFAIVGDVSANNPGDFFNQQHVPYFGYAFDNTYCSPTPTTSLYGFGFSGCLVPTDPKVLPSAGTSVTNYIKKKSGKQRPTVALFSSDSQSGKNSTRHEGEIYKAAGFDVVFAQGNVPLPPVSDYTPYVQQLLTSDSGKAPDLMVCLLSTDCIPIYALLRASNYAGTYLTSLYADALIKPLAGSLAAIPFVNLTSSTPGLDRMKQDVAAVKPGTAIDIGVLAGYLSTDMFIQALKTAAAKGKSNITPENIQRVASRQTWQIKGLAGPTKYPASTASPTPACGELVLDNGTAWETVMPYGCTYAKVRIK
jgi:branched-chain amino acid transport system substrate-binding protein